jgi:hypothetical protein
MAPMVSFPSAWPARPLLTCHRDRSTALGRGYTVLHRHPARATRTSVFPAPTAHGSHSLQAQLASIATQMGAAIKLDLTSDVTHLIVGSTDSAKYRYVAKCREDVKVLAPAWLEALRHVWLEGEDEMDVAGLEDRHRLPTFFGLKICLTGFDDRTHHISLGTPKC